MHEEFWERAERWMKIFEIFFVGCWGGVLGSHAERGPFFRCGRVGRRHHERRLALRSRPERRLCSFPYICTTQDPMVNKISDVLRFKIAFQKSEC